MLCRMMLYLFFVNVSVLAVVFRQKISRKATILPEIVGFLKIVDEREQLVQKHSKS